MGGNLVNPTCEVKVNSVAIAVQNILTINIHLGATKEVNSFEVVVNNSNPDYFTGQYSPGGAKVFTKGHSVTIKIKRGTITSSTNYLITGNLETLDYTDQREEYQYRDVVILRGRCVGQRLFNRKYNGDLIADVGTGYMNYNRTSGDASSLVAYLLDNYTGDKDTTFISHVRTTDALASNASSGQKNVVVTDGSKFTAGRLVVIKDNNAWEYNKIASIASNTLTMTSNLVNSYTTAASCIVGLDLIYTSNTSFVKMDFVYETVFDIIKFIADTTSSLGGVLGYDARIEYDGKLSFIPLNSDTESYSLVGEAQLDRYVDDASRIKNRIRVFGKQDKPYPLGTDGFSWNDTWTESVTSDVSQVNTNVGIGQNYVRCAAGAETHFVTDDIVTLIDIVSWGELFTVTKVVSSPTNSLLTGNAASGQKVVNVTDGSQFTAGDVVTISDDTPLTEDNVIASIVSNALTMETNLVNTYTTAQNAVVTQIDDVVYLDDDTTKAYTTANHAILAQVWANGGWAYTPNLQWDIFVVGYETTSPIYEGDKSIEWSSNASIAYFSIFMILPSALDMNEYTDIMSRLYFTTTAPDTVRVILYSGTCTSTEYARSPYISVSTADTWLEAQFKGGENNQEGWYITAGFDWTDVRLIRFYVQYSAAGSYTAHIDRFFTVGKRWGGGTSNSAVDGYAEDTTSQTTYGIKEHVVINDGLLADKECEAKAQALLLYYKAARTTYELESKTLDLVDYPVIPGNKVAVNLAFLGLSGSYRIDSCDIYCNAETNELTFNFTLESTPPKVSDYLYYIYKKLGGLERYGLNK